MIDYYGDQTRWFIGVVKSLEDPLKMGRLQVRIFGVHGQNLEEIPDEVLPWAQVLTPVTEGGTAGLGNFLGIQVDARVFGIFLDGKNSQMPLVMGSLPHSEKNESASGKKSEVTTNVNAQGTEADQESVDTPVDKVDLPTEKEEQEMIEEPQQDTVYKPVYPHNKVTQTTSGHLIEIDDTPESERIHVYHKSGTHVEIQPTGDVVIQQANGFRSVTGNDKLYCSGDVDWLIEGNVTVSSLKSISLNAKENINFVCEGTIDANAKTNVNVATDGSYINTNASTYISGSEGADIRGSRIDLNKGGTGTPSVKEFEWAGNEEPKDATPGGSEEVPTDADGNPLGPESGGGGPVKGEGKSGSESASDSNLSAPGDCGRKDLGSISSKYESNGKPGAIGNDSTGGFSYGSYQIATKTGTMGTFMNYLKKEDKYSDIYNSLNNAGGASAAKSGTQSFKGTWKNLAANNADFAQAQHDFIQRTHHDPAVSKIKASTGIDICDRSWSNGLQDAVWSTAVQHGSGGANKIFKRALARTGKTADTVTDQELINAIYDERGANNGMKYFPSSTSSVRNSVVNRFKSEKKLAIANGTKDSVQKAISNFNRNITAWTGL